MLPQIIKSVAMLLCEVLLPTLEDCMAIVNREMIIKNLTLQTDYRDI